MPVGPACLKQLPAVSDEPGGYVLGVQGPCAEKLLNREATVPQPTVEGLEELPVLFSQALAGLRQGSLLAGLVRERCRACHEAARRNAGPSPGYPKVLSNSCLASGSQAAGRGSQEASSESRGRRVRDLTREPQPDPQRRK